MRFRDRLAERLDARYPEWGAKPAERASGRDDRRTVTWEVVWRRPANLSTWTGPNGVFEQTTAAVNEVATAVARSGEFEIEGLEFRAELGSEPEGGGSLEGGSAPARQEGGGRS